MGGLKSYKAAMRKMIDRRSGGGGRRKARSHWCGIVENMNSHIQQSPQLYIPLGRLAQARKAPESEEVNYILPERVAQPILNYDRKHILSRFPLKQNKIFKQHNRKPRMSLVGNEILSHLRAPHPDYVHIAQQDHELVAPRGQFLAWPSKGLPPVKKFWEDRRRILEKSKFQEERVSSINGRTDKKSGSGPMMWGFMVRGLLEGDETVGKKVPQDVL